MPGGYLTAIQGSLAAILTQAQKVVTDAQALQLFTNPALTDAQALVMQIQAAQTLVANGGDLDQRLQVGTTAATTATQLQQQLATTNTQLAAANAKLAAAGVPATSTAITPPAGATQQTYVSTPAVGAIAIVAALVGAAGGYMGRGYVDQKKHAGASEAPAKKLKAKEAASENR